MSIVQNDTSPVLFYMSDSTDTTGRTPKTGLTPTVTLSKNGGAFAVAAGTVAEISNGWYKLTPATADVATLGDWAMRATATGADTWNDKDRVVQAGPVATDYTSARAAKLDVIDTIETHAAAIDTLTAAKLDVATGTLLTAASYTAPDNAGIAAIKIQTDNLPADPADESLVEAAITAAQTAVTNAITALNDLSEADIRTAVGMATANFDAQLDALPTAAENADAVGVKLFVNPANKLVTNTDGKVEAMVASGDLADLSALRAAKIDNLDMPVSGVAAAVWTYTTRTLSSFGTLVANIVSGVWDTLTADHQTTGTMGKALTDAQAAGDPLAATVPGAYGAGTAGKILGDLAGTKTVVDTINTKLPSDPADESLVEAAIASMQSALETAIAGLNDLDAVGVRAALGVATANIDAQLAALPTASENATAVLDAATTAPIHANTKQTNDVIVIGNGTDADPWRATGT